MKTEFGYEARQCTLGLCSQVKAILHSFCFHTGLMPVSRESLGPGYDTGHANGMLDLRRVILHGVWFHAGFVVGFKDQGEIWREGMEPAMKPA